MTEHKFCHIHASTRCVHAGMEQRPAEYGLNTPIVTSTAFDYSRDDQVRYPRYLNTPNHRVTAAKIAALEEAEDALVTASGLGAISAMMLSLLRPGDHAVLLDNLYGGTSELIEDLLKPMGIDFSSWDGDPVTLVDQLRPGTRLVLVESPTNPLLRIVDLPAVADILHGHDVIAVIDNTFATPVLQRPLDHGATWTLHSATKALGGHGDVIAGVVATSPARAQQLRQVRVATGALLDPQAAYLLHRSLPTLGLRVRAAQDNAIELAKRLDGHPGIVDVRYPGLPACDPHGLVDRQMDGPGSLLAVEVAGGDPVAAAVMEHVELFTPAVSLGSTDSLIEHPAGLTHHSLDAAACEDGGIRPGLLRLSVGIESIEDLWADLERALDAASSS